MKLLFRHHLCINSFLSIFLCLQSCQNTNHEISTEQAKIVIRDVGNQLLLADKDSSSVVLPIVQIEPLKYRLAFEENLAISPDSLVNIIERSFKMADMPQEYLVEVLQCLDQEVAYSYEMSFYEENTLIPCLGRQLAKDCYTIDLRLLEPSKQKSSKILMYATMSGLVLLLVYGIYKKRSLTAPINLDLEDDKKSESLGLFQFYPDQHKLVKDNEDISLSKKECEILAVFIASPNQVITRDKLTKKVWEDNGVFVGRSLDTYISKLRKKLESDGSLKITNIHGVGYKLEMKK